MDKLPIQQGEIYWADLNPAKGHEQAGERPVLIVQNNLLNRNLNTTIVAPITTNIGAKGLITTFWISKREDLKSDSVALFYQMRTIDKIRLKNRAAQLNSEELNQVKMQLSLLF
ncbi:type II toxin-antitoxin system PemK/MazF family toxin [Candidatus Peregrinibacteria bacterium]|nr:type II toxin-antitoxin system PemK/MazF family toxin [Candidatus Peregrinibacteria bacterium]